MFLSHRYRFLFVHVAKTGGTSMRTVLNPLRWRDPMYYLTWPAHKLSAMTGHRLALKFPRHAHVIAAKEILPADFFDHLFKFAFVRNPWDLQVSSFHHILRERPEVMAGHHTFNDFMRYKFDRERPPQYHIDTSLSLQTDYLVDLHGKILVDCIGRYESVQQDFRKITEHLQLPVRPLPHLRRATEREDYRSYYAAEIVDMVGRYFAEDIRKLDYRFE